MHYWHEKNNAVFVDAGVWLRPRYYKQGNENLFEASKREAKNVRQNVGVCDVTTLGKIDIKGPDSAEFLNRVYTCLLYTSPSPRDVEESRMPSSA